MIVLRLIGGFANQLFIWHFGQALERRGYEVRYDKSCLVLGTHREYSLAPFACLPIAEPTQKVIYENGARYNSEYLKPEDGSTMIGYWQTEKYIEDFAGDIRWFFHDYWMRTPLLGQARDVWKQIYKSCSVAVHVRRQDYVDLQDFHGLCSMDYYQAAEMKIRERVWDPKFFVFSDDPAWCQANFPPDYVIVEGTDKYEDLRLMAGCKHAVIANSSFSWWGAWLGDDQLSRTIIAPRRWFTTSTIDDRDITPYRWEKI